MQGHPSNTGLDAHAHIYCMSLRDITHNPHVARIHMWQFQSHTHIRTHTHVLTGVKEDHGLEADVLLPLQLELSHSGRGGYQHVEDLGEALHAAALLSARETQDVYRHAEAFVQVRSQIPKRAA